MKEMSNLGDTDLCALYCDPISQYSGTHSTALSRQTAVNPLRQKSKIVILHNEHLAFHKKGLTVDCLHRAEC